MNFLKNDKLFWDSDIQKLNPTLHKESIIERVLERGTWAEVKELIAFYGKSTIIEAATEARYFSDKTTHFISGYFSIPLEKMRCYNEKQLNPVLYL